MPLLLLRLGAASSLILFFGLGKALSLVRLLAAGHAVGAWGFTDDIKRLGYPAPALLAVVATLNEPLIPLVQRLEEGCSPPRIRKARPPPRSGGRRTPLQHHDLGDGPGVRAIAPQLAQTYESRRPIAEIKPEDEVVRVVQTST
jgi:hypothetical protein